MKNFKPLLKKILVQTVAITCISAACSLLVNAFRPDGLSPAMDDFSDIPVVLDSGKNAAISFSRAKAAYTSQSAVFIDARARVFFDHGHIEGALNIPWNEFDTVWKEALSDIGKDVRLILYCDGKKCPLSKNLANALFKKGYKNLHVLTDGWRLWQKYGLPVESGKQD